MSISRARARPDAIARAHRLGDSATVRIDVSRSTVALRDLGGDTKLAPRMRIKCVDDLGKPITRDTVAIRWVMTYVVARWSLQAECPS
jgi:hypothetical protein